MKFSERKGLQPIREALQLDAMSDDLRNSLWNLLYHAVMYETRDARDTERLEERSFRIGQFADQLWTRYFKKPVNQLPGITYHIEQAIQAEYFKLTWNAVYDFFEVVVKILNNPTFNQGVKDVLEEERAGYRLVDGRFIDVINPVEIAELENALHQKQGPYSLVAEHLSTALNLFADRRKPDYRNSIKESISAVERCVKVISEKRSCAGGLQKLISSFGLHRDISEAFSKLYQYTSDSNGIRHCLMDQSDLTTADARFFLVACSSFTNYLIALSERPPA